MKKNLFTAAITILIITSANTQCTHPDFEGLMEFYNSTGGSTWTNNSGWKEGAAGTNCEPCSGWYGVVCKNNRVEELRVFANNLNGKIPDLKLEFLWRFYIGDNKLSGTIPNFQNLPRLKDFWCARNLLTGLIPDFSNLPNLTRFHCHDNKLTGIIPNFLFLPNLEELSCANNQLTDTIPDFTNIPKLWRFVCDGNKLEGSIPDFSHLPKLGFFSCSNNKLNGAIPDFNNLGELREFDCEDNLLSGSIPDFSKLPKLRMFSCKNNNITGQLPNFSKIPLLWGLNCSKNKLSGSIPSFDKLPVLYRFECDNNLFTGSLPDIKNVVYLNFSDNDLEGCIPTGYVRLCKDSTLSYSDPYYWIKFSILSFGTKFKIDLSNNLKLPYSGEKSYICLQKESLSAPCDDGNPFTCNDKILNDCSCKGEECMVPNLEAEFTIAPDTISKNENEEIDVSQRSIIKEVKVYPNPVTSVLLIDFDVNHWVNQNHFIEIVNTLGESVYTSEVFQGYIEIDLRSRLEAGIYFIKIKSQNGTTIQTKKIVTQ
jgi:Leucine-rich repeat (LRR) protein